MTDGSLLGSDPAFDVSVNGGGDVVDESGVPLLVSLQVCG
jgi:hypothetical protein